MIHQGPARGSEDMDSGGLTFQIINQAPMSLRTILGIDPGTKEMGMAVTRGQVLVAYGVHTLRNGARPYNLIRQARQVLRRYLEDHRPNLVAIEAPLLLPTKRAALLSTIAQELHARARARSLRVVELSPAEIRKAVVGDPKATKIQVAEALVSEQYTELRKLVPHRPARSALGLKAKEKYWLHMFDALALAVAVASTQLREPPSSK
jgi:Holliday junction resolvasome RuvABC endonuclease subunit